MARRMLLVGRLGGDAQPVEGDARTHDVGERFGGVGDHGIGASE
jgi:hypothetical protein